MNTFEEKLYEIAGQEVYDRKMNKGVYAKALSDSLGDDKIATSLYIKYRVVHLKEEMKEEKRKNDKIKEEQNKNSYNSTIFRIIVVIVALMIGGIIYISKQ